MNIKHRILDATDSILNLITGLESEVKYTGKSLSIASPVYVLFISHDFALAGAQKVLLSIVRWLSNNATGIKYSVLELPNSSEDVLRSEFEEYCKVLTWDELSVNGRISLSKIEEKFGVPDVIYCNTVVCGKKIQELNLFGIPIVSHIHELEQSIQRFACTEYILNIRDCSALTIPVSPPVYENLILRHQFHEKDMRLIYPFIDESDHKYGKLSNLQTAYLNRINETNSYVVFGCGTPDWRKGTDIFVKVAAYLNDIRPNHFLFVWVGDFNDELEALTRKLQIDGQIIFFGRSENPGALFRLGDLFCLSSREDPYPLVGLEGAREGLPLVCFENSGGIPGFVKKYNTGLVCDYESVEAMSEAIIKIADNGLLADKYGKNGKKAVDLLHSSDATVPDILLSTISVTNEHCHEISIILPVFRSSFHLRKCIKNILNQSYNDFELIVLADTSVTWHGNVLANLLKDRRVKILGNMSRSESQIYDIIRALKSASGQYIWLADGNSIPHKHFLLSMHDLLTKEDSAIAMCNTESINKFGFKITPQPNTKKQHQTQTDNCWSAFKTYFKDNNILNFADFIQKLTPLSSCVFKRFVVDSEICELQQLKKFGPYCLVASQYLDCKISFHDETLNQHCYSQADIRHIIRLHENDSQMPIIEK